MQTSVTHRNKFMVVFIILVGITIILVGISIIYTCIHSSEIDENGYETQEK